MIFPRAEAERYLRESAKILVVGTPDVFTTVPLDSLEPGKQYLLAVVEVE